jgi:hypothetical protein
VVAKIIDGLGLRARIPVIVHGDDRCCADDMGRAARTWHHGRCSTATDGVHPCRNIFVLTRADPSLLTLNRHWG